MKPLKIPGWLAVTVLTSTAGCTSSAPSDASPAADVATLDAPQDTAVARDVVDASDDVCPDPFACYGELMPDGDGGATVAYHRADGSVSDVACPPAPPQCPVA